MRKLLIILIGFFLMGTAIAADYSITNFNVDATLSSSSAAESMTLTYTAVNQVDLISGTIDIGTTGTSSLSVTDSDGITLDKNTTESGGKTRISFSRAKTLQTGNTYVVTISFTKSLSGTTKTYAWGYDWYNNSPTLTAATPSYTIELIYPTSYTISSLSTAADSTLTSGSNYRKRWSGAASSFSNSISYSTTTTTTDTTTGGTTGGGGTTTATTAAVTAVSATSAAETKATEQISTTTTKQAETKTEISNVTELLVEVPKEAQELLDQANAKLAEAEKLKAEKKFDEAEKKAVEAYGLIEKANQKIPEVKIEEQAQAKFGGTTQSIQSTMQSAGITDQAKIENALRSLNQFDYTRELKVIQVKNKETQQASYQSNITVIIKNATDKRLSNLSIIESIPKEIIEKASSVKSSEEFKIIKEDPVIEWVIPEIKETAPKDKPTIEWTVNALNPGETKVLVYSIKKKIDKELLSLMSAPVAIAETVKVFACKDIECNDDNPCTIDSCVQGKCDYETVSDNTSCGANKVCKQGKCTSKSITPIVGGAPTAVTIAQEPAAKSASLYVIIGAIIAVFIIAFVFISRKKEGQGKSKGTEKNPFTFTRK